MRRVLRKRLQFQPLTSQMVPALRSTDKPLRGAFWVDFQAMIEVDGFAHRLVFTDEAPFTYVAKLSDIICDFGARKIRMRHSHMNVILRR